MEKKLKSLSDIIRQFFVLISTWATGTASCIMYLNINGNLPALLADKLVRLIRVYVCATAGRMLFITRVDIAQNTEISENMFMYGWSLKYYDNTCLHISSDQSR